MIDFDLFTSCNHKHLLTEFNNFTECLSLLVSHRGQAPIIQFCFFWMFHNIFKIAKVSETGHSKWEKKGMTENLKLFA